MPSEQEQQQMQEPLVEDISLAQRIANTEERNQRLLEELERTNPSPAPRITRAQLTPLQQEARDQMRPRRRLDMHNLPDAVEQIPAPPIPEPSTWDTMQAGRDRILAGQRNGISAQVRAYGAEVTSLPSGQTWFLIKASNKDWTIPEDAPSLSLGANELSPEAKSELDKAHPNVQVIQMFNGDRYVRPKFLMECKLVRNPVLMGVDMTQVGTADANVVSAWPRATQGEAPPVNTITWHTIPITAANRSNEQEPPW